MGDLVTTHSHDLIFQPTETLAARVLYEQKKSEEYEEQLEMVQSKYQKSRRWSFGFGGAAMALVAAGGMIWFMADSQIAEAKARLVAAESEQVDLSNALNEEREVTALQRETLYNLRDYEQILHDHDELKNVHLYTISWYRDRLGRSEDLPPDVQEALKYDPEFNTRLDRVQQELMGDKEDITARINVIRNYVKARLEEPIAGPECYPDVIFDTSGKKC